MWTYEHTEHSEATPAQVWARYADPRTWPEWDRSLAQASLRGPFAVGSRGTLLPVGGPAVRFRLIEVEPQVAFTDVARLPLARLAFGHRVRPTSTGSLVTHTITLSGPSSALLARVLGPGLARDVPAAVRALAGLAAAVPAAP